MSSWVTAWMISAICMAVMYRTARKMSLPWWLCLPFAAIFFIAPVGLIKSANSVVYMFDLFIPVILAGLIALRGQFWPKWGMPWSLLLVAAGLLPMLEAVLYAPDMTDFSISAVNGFRLIGLVGLIILLQPHLREGQFRDFYHGLRGVALIMMAAIALQAVGVIDVNLLNAMLSNGFVNPFFKTADARFVILGMFKAEQGILFMLAICCSLAYLNGKNGLVEKLKTNLFMFLCVCAELVTGSKTTLLCCALLAVLSLVRIRISKLMFPLATFAVASVAFIGFALTSPYARFYLNSTVLQFILSEGADVQTLDSRVTRFKETMDILADRPLILFGFYTQSYHGYNTAYFHNEYLSILMMGGVVALGLYLCFLAIIAIQLFANSRRTAFGLAGLLALAGNLVQGVAVAHLEPGVLFTHSVGLSLLLYSMGVWRPGGELRFRTPVRADEDLPLSASPAR